MSGVQIPPPLPNIGFVMVLPKIAITMGDPSGIGPEIVVGAYKKSISELKCVPIVIGNIDFLYKAISLKKIDINIEAIRNLRDINFVDAKTIFCFEVDIDYKEIDYGINTEYGGEFSYQCIKKAVDLALNGEVEAICTAPISKESLHMAGHNYPGHTEMLADFTDTKEVSLMLMTPKLNVIHVTTHMGLIDSINKIDDGLVFRTIERGRVILEKVLGRDPKVGVCAINPHAGENEAFGYGEENSKILPAIKKCENLGWNVKGPLAADSLFYTAVRGDFDLVVAMYHDQGHGPVKVLGIEHGINVTTGLPIVRTSVDHGTAFDIAGQGVADEINLLNAIKQALILIGKV